VWGIPLFDEVTIQLPDHALNLTTENNADYLLFVKERIADGQPIDQATITHQKLIDTQQLTTDLQLLPSL
jgi:putative alpha-1,2-mannosidase